MTGRTRECSIETCTNTIGPRARDTTIFCTNCRQSISFWTKTKLSHALSRREKLSLYAERVERVLAERKRS
jgi:uncharacterized Rmd1/YagE family protein